MKQEYERKDVPTGKGAHTMSMMTGKHRDMKTKALEKKKIPKEYRGNTNSEGGISFGKKPK